MPDPFRLRVMKALTTAIKQVTPANGCLNDLSDYTDEAGRTAERVFRGRDLFGESDGLPMVSILEDFRRLESDPSGKGGKETVAPFRVLVQGFVRDDPDNPLDPAYILEAEVRRALIATRTRYNVLGLGDTMPCVTDLTVGQPTCRPADNEVSTVAYFFLPVTLTLVEDLANPFA
jgi:hypothetical protein